MKFLLITAQSQANHSSTIPNSIHTSLIGCEELGFVDPESPQVVWDCGVVREHDYPFSGICKKGAVYMFRERNHGQKSVFGEGLGFKVGPGTGINYIILRTHYIRNEIFQSEYLN